MPYDVVLENLMMKYLEPGILYAMIALNIYNFINIIVIEMWLLCHVIAEYIFVSYKVSVLFSTIFFTL